jgi:hypothetical protein
MLNRAHTMKKLLVLLALLLAAIPLLNIQVSSAEDSIDINARPPALQQRMDAALAAKGSDYHPRTEHLFPDGRPRYTNRLILEDSPYLLQHAHNPVDWYPWGKEAFDKAKRENKLIFLSIGYSTCHWCHVMEKESFENLAIARQLNQHFVAIKVDRESRPDLDHLYMTAVNLIAGRGGWPMSSLLTPDGNTVHGGTYYPPDALARLLTKAEQQWCEHPDELKAQSAAVARAVDKAMAREAAVAELPPTLVATTTQQLLEHHDALQGGFSTAPKFPNEPLLALLLDQAVRANDQAAQAALLTDLDAMAAGGIHDQAGGGFFRYSTDSEWLVPHFEKMLYTQAQLARLYVGAYRLTGKPEYARVAHRTLDFALRRMLAQEGGFYSALDADSAAGEGQHYLWTPAEVTHVLNADDAALAIQSYGLTPAGNFAGSNILHLSRPVSNQTRARLDRIDAALLKARQQRPHPQRDDKVLTGWNGLMITALAEAGDQLDEPRYLTAARHATEFIWQHHRRTDGSLWRVSLNGRASTAGMLEDYAYLAEGLIALYDATGEAVWLTRAQQLADAMQSRFADQNNGGYFLAEADPDTPMARPRATADGALPSANGVVVQVLAALARRGGEMRFEKQAQAQLAALSGAIQHDPASHATLLTAIERLQVGETGARQYAGRGAVMAMAHAVPQGEHGVRVELTLRIKSGWHINAHLPLQDYLIPTTLKAVGEEWHIVHIDYPQAELAKLGFQTETLALYQGKVPIHAELQSKTTVAGGNIPLELSLQACSDQLCLPPETLRLNISAR